MKTTTAKTTRKKERLQSETPSEVTKVTLNPDNNKTVRMVRDVTQYRPPHTADVALQEIDNWKKLGWKEL